MPLPEDDQALIAGVRAGDRRALAKAITLLESTRAEHRRRADAVLGFWTGDHASGTGACLAYAARTGREVWVETIAGAR